MSSFAALRISVSESLHSYTISPRRMQSHHRPDCLTDTLFSSMILSGRSQNREQERQDVTIERRGCCKHLNATAAVLVRSEERREKQGRPPRKEQKQSCRHPRPFSPQNCICLRFGLRLSAARACSSG